jgi:UDP-N-acetyl-D-galactosamine dehydrogenase
MNFKPGEPKIAIIGLGYVGLPLAVAFAEKYPVIGFDINTKRIQELNDSNDSTLEIESDELNAVLSKDLKLSKGLFCTTDRTNIADCNIYIVTVPTPVDKYNRPDLTPMLKASETVAAVLSPGNIVIYESTVYPGVTEDECVPVLERLSGLKFNVDFVAGYSPERINPGDKERTVKKIKKVTSGSTPANAKVRSRALIDSPSSFALSSLAKRAAVAPSFSPDEFPAVTRPAGRKGVFSPASPSIVVVGRGDSSTVAMPQPVSG